MPKTPNAQAPQRADTRGGGMILLPLNVVSTPQFQALSFRARCAVLAVATFFNGYNNGHIGISTRQLADALGSHNYTGNEAALQEAILAGFVERTREYAKARRLASEYRLTWVCTGKAPHFVAATHDYLAGEPVKKQRRQQPSKSVATIAAGVLRSSQQVRQQPASTIAAGEAENGRPPVSIIASPIVSITTPPSPSDGDLETVETSRGLERPRSMTQDAWILAQRRASANPATADDDHVRAAAISYLSSAARGEQTRLSEAADIPGPALSKFLKGGTLADDRLGRLMLELMKRGGASIARAA